MASRTVGRSAKLRYERRLAVNAGSRDRCRIRSEVGDRGWIIGRRSCMRWGQRIGPGGTVKGNVKAQSVLPLRRERRPGTRGVLRRVRSDDVRDAVECAGTPGSRRGLPCHVFRARDHDRRASRGSDVRPRAIPPENQSCFPAAGECIWFFQAPHALYGFADELWELGIFYANGGSLFGVAGWTPCNVWGRMTENLEAFSADCRDIRRNGIQIVEFGRWNDQ